MEKPLYEAVIFDLDGTLLDTLEDLTNATNHAMRCSGYPEHTQDEVRTYVGNGVGMLIRRALPHEVDCDEEAMVNALQAFKRYYAEHNQDVTVPYDGIMEMLGCLKDAGVKLAIVSNKNDPNVQALSKGYFGSLIDVAIGERTGVRRKPCPDTLNAAIREMGAAPERTLYVGDSDVDVETARNADIAFSGVSWGFHTKHELLSAGAERVIDSPAELTRLVLKRNASKR